MLALALTMLGLGIGPASAHHPEISASGDCDGTISWTSTAWQNNDEAARTNDRVQVERSVNGGAWEHVVYGAYKAPSFSFSGTFTVTDPTPGTSVVLRATTRDSWGNGVAGGQTRESSAVTFDSCETPTAKPVATIDVDCDGYDLELDNADGTAPATFTVTTPTGATKQVTVAAGKSTTKTYPAVEDTKVSVNAEELVLLPGAEVQDCGIDGGNTDGNTGGSRSSTDGGTVAGVEGQVATTGGAVTTPVVAPQAAGRVLPATGASVTWWVVMAATALILTGLGMITARRLGRH